jgi:CHAT domain-containing protein
MLLPDDVLPATGRELYIVPDELLRDVSFAALRTHATYLVDRHPIAYAPSAAILAIARTRAPSRPPVVIGDPTSDRAGARAEATEVGGLLGVAPSLGASATIATVLAVGDAEVLHVASHAGATHQGPVLKMSDGDVLGTAIIEHRVGPALVVLTGCSSGYAEEERDEFGSLAAAFIAAGAATVIASRIDVDDAVARRFAHLFYEANGVRDPVGAVARAQRRLRSEGVRTAQWSTFMVVGGLRTTPTGRGGS